MAASAASAQNVQQAVTMLRQVVQAEQVVAAALIEASKQAAQSAPSASAPSDSAPGVGDNLDVTA